MTKITETKALNKEDCTSVRMPVFLSALFMILVFLSTLGFSSSAFAEARENGVAVQGRAADEEFPMDVFAFLNGTPGTIELVRTQYLDVPVFAFADSTDESYSADAYLWIAQGDLVRKYFSFDMSSPGWKDLPAGEDMTGKGIAVDLPRYLGFTWEQVLSPEELPAEEWFDLYLCLDVLMRGYPEIGAEGFSCGVATIHLVEPSCDQIGLVFDPPVMGEIVVAAGTEMQGVLKIENACGGPAQLVTGEPTGLQWKVESTADWLVIDALKTGELWATIKQGAIATARETGWLKFYTNAGELPRGAESVNYPITKIASGGGSTPPAGTGIRATPSVVSVESAPRSNPSPSKVAVSITDSAGVPLDFSSVTIAAGGESWVDVDRHTGTGAFNLVFHTETLKSGSRTTNVSVVTSQGTATITVKHTVKFDASFLDPGVGPNTCASGSLYTNYPYGLQIPVDAGTQSGVYSFSAYSCAGGKTTSAYYSATASAAWLRVSSDNTNWGSTAQGTGTIFVRVEGAALSQGGSYTGNVQVTAGSYSVNVPITPLVSGCVDGTLMLSSSQWSGTAKTSATTDQSTSVAVRTCDGPVGGFNLTVSPSGAGWLTATPSAGTTGFFDIIVKAPAAAGLTAGVYTATVTVSLSSYPSVPFTVNYTVEAPGMFCPGDPSCPPTGGGSTTLTLGERSADVFVPAGSCGGNAPCTDFGTLDYQVYIPAGTTSVNFQTGTLDFKYDSDMIVMHEETPPVTLHPFHPDSPFYGVLSLKIGASTWNPDAIYNGHRYYWKISRGGEGATESWQLQYPQPGWYHIRLFNISEVKNKLFVQVN